VALAVALALIGVSVYLPTPAARAGVAAAVILAALIWVFGEALGAIFTGTGTDPNSGPLLALLALAYWPTRAGAPAPAAASAPAQPALQEGQ
jgi:hypothetical protein